MTLIDSVADTSAITPVTPVTSVPFRNGWGVRLAGMLPGETADIEEGWIDTYPVHTQVGTDLICADSAAPRTTDECRHQCPESRVAR